MNDEELDLLASAYVDGEATPEEVALVERDPELQARVEAFRALEVSGPVTPPAGLVDRHLAAAMAEFQVQVGAAATDEPATAAAAASSGPETAADDVTAPVVDLRAEAAKRGPRRGSANGSRPARAEKPRTMPSWLAAAAGLVIVGGGFVWAVNQTGGSDDSADTEAAAEASDESADASTETEAFDSDDSEESAAMAAMPEEEAMEESDDAMEEEGEASDDGATRSDPAGSDAAAPADGDTDDSAEDDEASADEDAEGDVFDPTPLLVFDEIPDVDTIEDLPEPEPNLERSLCGPEIVTTTLGEPLGFIPVEVEGQPAELYLFQDGDGAEIRLLVDADCQPLTP